MIFSLFNAFEESTLAQAEPKCFLLSGALPLCSRIMWLFSISFFLNALCALLNSAEAFAITGISAGVDPVTGERPFRHDINDLYMSGPAWDLFILSLREFQQVDQDDPLSYYQVAGKATEVCYEKARC